MAYHHTKFVPCPRCGKTTVEGVGKCYHCGGPIGGQPPVVETEPGYTPAEQPVYTPFDSPAKPTHKAGGIKKIALGGVAAVTVALGGVGLLGGSDDPAPVVPEPDPVPEIVLPVQPDIVVTPEAEPEPEQTAQPQPEEAPNPEQPTAEQVTAEEPEPVKPSEEQAPVNQPTADPTPIAPSEVPKAAYVGSKKSNKYHEPDCPWVEEINDENYVAFDSVEEAKALQYVACKTCYPT